MQGFKLLFYGKNHKAFHAIYQYLQSQRTAILSHGKGNCSVTYLLSSPWAMLIDISSREKQKSKGQLFAFGVFLRVLLPHSTYCNINLHVTVQQTDEEMGWSSSKNNRKEKGNGSWGFMTSVRVKMDERRRKSLFLLPCVILAGTIRGAGSLSIFLEGSGPTVQIYCAEIKMDRTLVGFANLGRK